MIIYIYVSDSMVLWRCVALRRGYGGEMYMHEWMDE